MALCAILESFRRRNNSRLRNSFAQEVKEVNADQIDPCNNGEAVFVKGNLIVFGPPSDPDFNVNTESEVLLHRKVEVYCYKEEITEVEERQGD